MQLDHNDLKTARLALRDRAIWASARGFFWLSERDLRMLERLQITSHMTDADTRHLYAVLRRVGGQDNETLARKIGTRI